MAILAVFRSGVLRAFAEGLRRLAPIVSAALLISSTALADCYVVGTWNLEHFGFGKKRGFPEITGQLEARTDAQINGIAAAIRDRMRARILVLNEINGRQGQASSAELEDLTRRLGQTWRYAIAKSGISQRNAIVWDTRFVDEIARHEIYIAPKEIQDDDIFDRDPLVMYFRFKENGQPRNDLVVVALHLASGTHQTANHDAAMTRLRAELSALRGRNPVLPRSEDDIVLAGDLNASAYDNDDEEFFRQFDRGNWKVLANGPTYPATRISRRQLDWIIVTRKTSRQDGLWGEEINSSPAKVWQELAPGGDWSAFRRDYSDHFPVTTCVEVTTDTD